MSFAGASRRPSSWRAALVGAIVAALATLPGLGVGTLWDNSETVYGEVAREILLYGDPIVMHLNARPWFVQPPLYFWIAAFSAKLFGVSAFSLRLPSALATIGMGAFVGLCAGRLVSLRAAVFCSVILSTTLMQAVVGRLAIMDALLNLAVTVTVFGAFAALRTGRALYWYGASIAAGFGVLAKGPVALVVPVLIIGAWAFWERRSAGSVRMPVLRWWLGALLCLELIDLPWATLVARAAGPHALAVLLGHYTVGRYVGAIENQTGPIWYYLPVVILGFFPWSAFLVPALVHAYRRLREPQGSLQRLCVAWAIVPFVFFSFAQTKLPNYIALVLPALALLVAIWFDDIVEQRDRRVALAWAALVPVTIGVLGIAIRLFSQSNRLSADLHTIFGDLTWLGLTTLTGSILCFVLLTRKRTAVFAPAALAAASLASMFIIAFVAEPHAEVFKPIPKLAAAIDRERRSGDVVTIWGVAGSYALEFYTRPRVLQLNWRDFNLPRYEQSAALCTAPRAFLVTSRKLSLPTYGRRRRELAHEGGDVLYLYDGRPCG
ncbi:MAG TPA: glycosyltransferase family 39 protein [Candidatus Acidoferrales bacterium]|nr:glycosyltransferase family 39 protein [Candidatus Acidoferrales bacterium]